VKAIDFHARALEFIREQAMSIRRHLGEALLDLQKGVNLGTPLSRPMTGIAPGVHELRIRGEGAPCFSRVSEKVAEDTIS
jgi:phage-related protein